jgi:hypothetical protein
LAQGTGSLGAEARVVDVFISWSKSTSHEFAKILYKWLPEVIQVLDPWLSSEDIDKGSQWAVELGKRLQDSSQSIICVTPDNFDEPWLNFEAGALARSLDESRVHPLLFSVEPAALTGRPLAQFQATVATESTEMLKLLKSLEKKSDKSIGEERLQRALLKHWKDFLGAVDNVRSQSAGLNTVRRRAQNDQLTQMVSEIHQVVVVERPAAAAAPAVQALPIPPGFESPFPPEMPSSYAPQPYTAPTAATSTDHVLATHDTPAPRTTRYGTPGTQKEPNAPTWPPETGTSESYSGSSPAAGSSESDNQTRRPEQEPGAGRQYVAGA